MIAATIIGAGLIVSGSLAGFFVSAYYRRFSMASFMTVLVGVLVVYVAAFSL